jgi:hypothetical protein
MSHDGLQAEVAAQAYPSAGGQFTDAIRSGGPAILFGLRLWVAVALALYVA